MRMRGGSPSNMGQKKYWVRRHLDDQRRTRGAENRRIAEEVRQEKAAARERSDRAKALDRLERQEAAAARKVALWCHFEKVQNELKRALDLFSKEDDAGTYIFEIEFKNDQQRDEVVAAQIAFQEHADWMNENAISITATALAKQIANTKKLLIAVGRATDKKVRWKASECVFTFGDLQLDFSAPEVGAKRKGKQAANPRKAVARSVEDQDHVVSKPASEGTNVLLWGVGIWAVFFVCAGVLTGWKSFGEVLLSSIVLPFVLIILVGIFSKR